MVVFTRVQSSGMRDQGGMQMRRVQLASLLVPVILAIASGPVPAAATGAGVGNLPQGAQSDSTYARSYWKYGVTNVSATTQKVSCYRPEVPFFTVGEARGYTGMTPCPGATTGENTGSADQNPTTRGIYPNQVGSAPGYPAARPMLVNNHSESDLRVDPLNPNHI